MTRTAFLWCLWIALTLVAGSALAGILFVGGPRDLMLIGKTTSAHKQIELACESCHTTGLVDNLTKNPKKLAKAMTKACLSCHKAEKEVSNDSHPPKKFRGAKAAKLRAALNAQQCTTCHTEHVPELTGANAVTLPMDLCSACHQKIGEDRESHKGLAFTTCASAGCHNFHDNTALYEKFLVKHAGGDWLKDHPVQAFAAEARATPFVLSALRSESPVETLKSFLDTRAGEDTGNTAVETLGKVLGPADAIAPKAYLEPEAVAAWSASAHATNGINCGGCHAPDNADTPDLAALETNWTQNPGVEVCSSCHKPQMKSFSEGKHGMRLHAKLAKPRKRKPGDALAVAHTFFKDAPLPPFKVGDSYLAPFMKPEAHDRALGNCGNCHKPHEVDLEVAAVESCSGCHDDTHTKNYFASPHYSLWQKELAGKAEPGTGVSCADCHMPKLEGRAGGFFTTHNQNAYFRPNEKMIRPVCLSCHSLEFSIDALADPKLVESNFNGRPSVHIESIDWALSRER
jgi:hypothetical protein